MNDQNAKRDSGKVEITLVPMEMVEAAAVVRMYGNEKYPEGGADNWKDVSVERYRNALFRHLFQYLREPYGIDHESGLPHLWHLACNIAFLCELDDPYRQQAEPHTQAVKKSCRNCSWVGKLQGPCLACEKYNKWQPVFYEEEPHGRPEGSERNV